MRVLAIDCSTEWLSVAIGDETTCVERREAAGQAHSQRALPLVNALLAERGLDLADLDGIAFAAGPGSFTGVRIACGIAQGLALGAALRVVPVGTLEAIAEGAWQRHGEDRVFACLDARMREVYVAAYERVAEVWRERIAPAVLDPSAVVMPEGEWFAAGPGFGAYPSLAGAARIVAADTDVKPSAVAILALAMPRLAAGHGVEASQALPLYVRHRVALTGAERAAGMRL